MTHRERLIKTLKCGPIGGQAPAFELVLRRADVMLALREGMKHFRNVRLHLRGTIKTAMR